MTIEIHQPEIEALIRERLETGAYRNVEDLLLHVLKSSPEPTSQQPEVSLPESSPTPQRKSLARLFAESPFRGLDLEFPRQQDHPRPVDLGDLRDRSDL